MTQANGVLRSDKRALDAANVTLSQLGLRYGGTVEVKHLLEILEKDYGLDRLVERIKVNLSDLRVAPFYGCHLLRPERSHTSRRPPNSMETLIENLGGTVVDSFARKTCCGFPVLLTNERLGLKMSGEYLKRIKDEGADCIVTPCPLCHISFDMYQQKAEATLSTKIGIPILHLPQLVGLGLGLDARQLMIDRHMVSATELLKRIGA
jgi:succinate dehydrogenase / fumarate reductase cytochrome b subunit